MNEICKVCVNKKICRHCSLLTDKLKEAEEQELEFIRKEGNSMFNIKINVTCDYFKHNGGMY